MDGLSKIKKEHLDGLNRIFEDAIRSYNRDLATYLAFQLGHSKEEILKYINEYNYDRYENEGEE